MHQQYNPNYKLNLLIDFDKFVNNGGLISTKNNIDNLLKRWHIIRNNDGYYYGYGNYPKEDLEGAAFLILDEFPKLRPYIKECEILCKSSKTSINLREDYNELL